MSGHIVRTREGGTIVCARGQTGAARCVYCHRLSTHRCDHGVGDRVVKGWTFAAATCDAPLCELHRVVSGGKDYCRDHAPRAYPGPGPA